MNAASRSPSALLRSLTPNMHSLPKYFWIDYPTIRV
jgi:hypothetical protein